MGAESPQVDTLQSFHGSTPHIAHDVILLFDVYLEVIWCFRGESVEAEVMLEVLFLYNVMC